MPHLSLWAFFYGTQQEGRRDWEKVLDDKKCWGQRSRPALFFFGTKGEDRNSFVSIHRNKFAVQKQRVSDGAIEKRTLREAENKEKGSTESKTNHTVLLAKSYSYLPATCDRGERVSNGLPGQTVKGRDCNTEEGGCFGNAEAPDDDHCNPAHVWNFSFLVYP